MKHLSNPIGRAFTFIELLVVIVIAFILFSMLLPTLGRGHPNHSRIRCVNNLRQVATGMRVWASGEGDKYPWELVRRYQIRFRDPNNTDAEYELGNWNGTGPGVTASQNSRLARAWTYFAVMSNELGSPKILRCPANALKKNSIATDWSTNTTGFWNTANQKNGNSPIQRSQRKLYGQAPGYDGSISYSVLRTPRGLIARGWELALAPGAMVSWDYNVGYGARATLSGYPNIDPIPGGPFRSWHNADTRYHDASSGMRGNALGNRNINSEDWGFVAGKKGDHYAVHGGQTGNIAHSDGSVTQVRTRHDFIEAGLSHHESMRGTLRRGTNAMINWGAPLVVTSPW